MKFNFIALIDRRIEQKTVSAKTLDHKDTGHDFPSAIQTSCKTVADPDIAV